jgi:hypothetical protein
MNLEKHGRGVEQARQMLDVFASLGTHTFDLTQTDIDGHKQSFHPAQSLTGLQHRIPYLMQAAVQSQHNLIVRPRSTAVDLIQLDDLSAAQLERARAAAFLILTTSPGNHQAWVGVRAGTPDLPRRLRQGSGADPSASGATRISGSLNFKRRYAPDFPMVYILEASPQRVVTVGQLESLGLLAAPNQVQMFRHQNRIGKQAKQWPSYERCLQNAPPAHRNSKRPDVSRADFTFCLLAIDWGWSLTETCQRLLEKSCKARENGQAYAWLTVRHAAAVIQRRSTRTDAPQPSPGGFQPRGA